MCKIKEFAIVYIAFILVFILINISLYQINISCKSLLEFNMNNERIAEHKKENLLTFSQEAQISDITEIYEWKIIIPKITLVTGSNMLNIDAVVAPKYLTPCCKQIIPIIDVKIAIINE